MSVRFRCFVGVMVLAGLLLSGCGADWYKVANPTATAFYATPEPETLTGAEASPQDTTAEDEQSEQNEVIASGGYQNATTVTLDAIVARPQEFSGQQVTVRGTIGETLGPSVFRLNDTNAVSARTSNALLVITSKGVNVPTQGNVAVTGTVHNFVLADIEQELGLDLQDDVYADYANQPVIIATSVTATTE